MKREKKKCVFCGSRWTYVTGAEIVCRKCGGRTPLNPEEYIPKKIEEVKE
jgi:DNA-directed RNA polymerase subunit RPC12/RpoP